MSLAKGARFFLPLGLFGQIFGAVLAHADDSTSRLPAAEVVKISDSIETLNSDPYRPTTHELNKERSGSRVTEQERRRRFVEEALGASSADLSSESNSNKKKAPPNSNGEAQK